MREIKFRAWDGEKFYQPILVDGKIFRSARDFEDYIDYNDILQQYTGLKDKNGTEIYEGDVVEQITTINWYLCHGVVIFEQGKFLVNVKKADFSSEGFKSDFDLKIREYTVIGNIYENPELLGDAK